jgi:hypothetical protein
MHQEMTMIFSLRVLIVLAAITQFATLNFPPISPDWFQNQAKSQIAASQLAEHMSAMR